MPRGHCRPVISAPTRSTYQTRSACQSSIGRDGFQRGQVFDAGHVGEHLGVLAQLVLQVGELFSKLGASRGVAEGGLLGEPMPFGREGPDDLAPFFDPLLPLHLNAPDPSPDVKRTLCDSLEDWRGRVNDFAVGISHQGTGCRGATFVSAARLARPWLLRGGLLLAEAFGHSSGLQRVAELFAGARGHGERLGCGGLCR